VKRKIGGYCMSRGRKRNDAKAGMPCTAWINEALLKLIAYNLCVTVTIEEETGYAANYFAPTADVCFPAPLERLIAA
jgi:hypothetical protein